MSRLQSRTKKLVDMAKQAEQLHNENGDYLWWPAYESTKGLTTKNREIGNSQTLEMSCFYIHLIDILLAENY